MNPEESPMDPAEQMDRMYRYQRHWYDLSREYYLLGRDRLLRQMEINDGDNVLESACGTARNLIALAKLHPKANFFGIDASRQMLQTAEEKIAAMRMPAHISVVQGLAEDVRRQTFNLDVPFDSIFFSYGLSMIPSWKEAIRAALANLKTGGRLYIVDFWDQRELPVLFQRALKAWLALFGVHYRRELLDHLQFLADHGHCELQIEPVSRRYAFIATLTKNVSITPLSEIAALEPRSKVERALTGSFA